MKAEKMEEEKNSPSSENEKKNEDEIFESNAAKLLRLRGGAETPERQPEEPVKKAGFFENLWYHYKTIILVSIGFLIILAVGITQMVKRESPDVYVLFAGSAAYDMAGTQAAEEALSALITTDRNGDGKFVAQFTTICYVSDEKAAAAAEEAKQKDEWSPLERYAKSQENRDAYKAFSDDMLAGDSVIVLLDPYLFSTVRDAGGLMPVAEALGFTPDGTVDEYGVKVTSIPFFADTPAFAGLPDDTVFAIRRVSTMSFFTGKKKEEEAHAAHVEFAKAIFSYIPENVEN